MPSNGAPWVAHPPEKGYLWRHHGLTLEEWWALFRLQCGVCAICGKPRRLHVDHDHRADHKKTKGEWSQRGAIRGLICWICNTALQAFREDKKAMRNSVAYLDNPPAWRLWLVEKRPIPQQGELDFGEEV